MNPNDPAYSYLEQLERMPELNDAEADQLAFCLLSEGAGEARRQLAQGHLRMAGLFAAEYAGRGIVLMDLIQAANQALIASIDSFPEAKGARFKDYASWRIRISIEDALGLWTIESRLVDAEKARGFGLIDEMGLILDKCEELASGLPNSQLQLEQIARTRQLAI